MVRWEEDRPVGKRVPRPLLARTAALSLPLVGISSRSVVCDCSTLHTQKTKGHSGVHNGTPAQQTLARNSMRGSGPARASRSPGPPCCIDHLPQSAREDFSSLKPGNSCFVCFQGVQSLPRIARLELKCRATLLPHCVLSCSDSETLTWHAVHGFKTATAHKGTPACVFTRQMRVRAEHVFPFSLARLMDKWQYGFTRKRRQSP